MFVAQKHPSKGLFLLFLCEKVAKTGLMSFFSVEWLKPVDVSNSPGRQAGRQKHFIGLLLPAGGKRKEALVFHFTLQLM